MKRSIILAWGLILAVFALGLFGLAGRGGTLLGEEKIDVPDPGEADSAVTIRVKLGDAVQEMDLDTYLQGVLRAEMPASFEEEALKAQAVAARTETLYKVENGPVANHPEADICDDVNCCQAFLPAETAEKNWGKQAKKYAAKIAAAVRETDGMVILYEDEPILAAFFSSASGRTNPSGDVWVNDLPYLRSVQSPEGENEVPNYYSVASFSPEEFREIFLAAHPEADLDGAPEDWISAAERSDSDMVLSIVIGGVKVKGTEVRALFSLRSAAFTVAAEEGEIVFRVTGYGHGVGMSQYGANVMAAEGSTWREILEWYYTGVTIGPYTPKNLAET